MIPVIKTGDFEREEGKRLTVIEMHNNHGRSLLFQSLAVSISLFISIPCVTAAPPLQWYSVGVGGGGAMFSPSFSPHNPNQMFAASDMGGLFQSNNLGASWSTISFLNIRGGRGCHVQFTNDPNILYALDYSPVDGADLVRPARSNDGGATWAPLVADPADGYTYSLFADPANYNRLIVTSYDTLYFSSDGGTIFSVKYTYGSDTDGLYVAGAFYDGNNIYLGTNAGVVYSTNGGVTFALAAASGLPFGKKICAFTGARQGTTRRFFALVSATSYAGMQPEDLFWTHQDAYTLDSPQTNWVLRSTGLPTGDGNGLAFVATALNNIATAYASGQDANYRPSIYKTTNGGTSWQSVLTTQNNANVSTGWDGDGGDRGWDYGAETLGLAVAPNDATRAAFTDLGFLHLTTDGGTTWRQAYLNPADQNPQGALTPKRKYYRGVGFENTSCWWLTWSDPNNIFACFSDIRATRTTDGGASWSFDYAGLEQNSAYQCVRNNANGTLYLASSSIHDIYQSAYLTDFTLKGEGGVLYSTDTGAAWLVLHNFRSPVMGLALDPNNPNRLLASVVNRDKVTSGGIWVSEDIQNGGASAWTRLPSPPRTEGHPFNVAVLNDGTLVCTYSGRVSGFNFTASSGVFVMPVGSSAWLDRSDPGMCYWTKDIVIDPNDPAQNRWYAGVYSGWGVASSGLGGLYRTTDRGQSWTRINALDRVGSCAINPANPDAGYLATENDGLWYSDNLTAPTPGFTQVTSYPFDHPERIFFNPHKWGEIWVTSFGNGLYIGSTDPTGVTGWKSY